MSSQPSGSTNTMSASGQAKAIPDESPPPPHGITIRAGGCSPASASWARISSPTVPCPATIAGSAKLGTTVAPLSSAMPRGNFFAALRRPVVEDDFSALGPRPFDLHRRRVSRHDDHRPDPKPAGGDRHAPGVIARGKSHDALFALPVSQLQQPVGRAPQFEGAAGLQSIRISATGGHPRLCLRSAACARPARRSARQPL